MKIGTILEIIIFTIVVIIVLWLGAFLLRDKSEFFCKMSFGEYGFVPGGRVPTVQMKSGDFACFHPFIIDKFYNKK